MKLAVLLLCHEAPETVARRLGSAFYDSPEVKAYLHHDRASPHHDRAAFAAALPPWLQWHWIEPAVACRWGDYSLVRATLALLRAALEDPSFTADHFLLASGSCRPVRPLGSLQAFLQERPGIDFIEAHDISRGRWTQDGLERERFEYWFPFNYARQRRRFELATAVQRRLGVRRRFPAGFAPHFGSQWWCLTRATARSVVHTLARPELARFFAGCWIPDEFAIQTVVARLQAPARIAGHGLTYAEFDALGKPLVLEDWHADHLAGQPFFFARKVSPRARALEARFDARVAAPEADLGWFTRVGRPTPDFGRFLERLRADPGQRARVGSFRPQEGGPMAASRRRYYVLVGSSRAHVARILARARALAGPLSPPPILDFPFARSGLQPAAERLRWFGLGPEDRLRARHDGLGMLYELVHLDSQRCTAFGLDPAVEGEVREQVLRDANAVIVDCDPPGLGRAQRAAMALREVGGAHEAWVSLPMRQALAEGTPLPVDALRRARARGLARCRWVRPDEATAFDDPTWRLLTAAALGVCETQFVVPREFAGAILGVDPDSIL